MIVVPSIALSAMQMGLARANTFATKRNICLRKWWETICSRGPLSLPLYCCSRQYTSFNSRYSRTFTTAIGFNFNTRTNKFSLLNCTNNEYVSTWGGSGSAPRPGFSHNQVHPLFGITFMRFSSKKAQGSARNGRNSIGRRLGLKKWPGEHVKNGEFRLDNV